ncbi:MAG: MFS transporter [Rhodanobacteraceae bacterium]
MSGHNPFRLLKTRRFAPFFATQALGAFNDNAFRYALLVLVAFHLGLDDAEVTFYSNIGPALFILPFFLFSASAGQLAEKFEKTRIIRYVKLFEIGAMALAAIGFHTHSVALLLAILFLMGVHSTVFGPIKYAILPQALKRPELLGGNGLVEMGTSLAILLGMVAGGSLMALGHLGPTLASILVLGVALSGYLVSRAIPAAPATAPDLVFRWNPFTETARVLGIVARERTLFVAVLGISWFWFFGGVFTAQLPNYTKLYLGGGAGVSVLVLTLFSIGVGAGSILCEKLSGGRIESGLVPFGAIGLTVFGVDLYFARPGIVIAHGLDALAFLSASGSWRIALDMTLIGLFAGFYIVPLFALVQSRAMPSELSRIIAGNNVLNALFIVAAAVFCIVASKHGVSIPQLFLITALANAGALALLCIAVPEFPRRFIAWASRDRLGSTHPAGQNQQSDDGKPGQ